MEFENNSNTEEKQENEISSNEENSNNNEDESFLDRMQHEKRKHTQSIEILHRRRPTREQLMEAGIIKPTDNFTMELGIVVEDILEDIKQNDIDTELKQTQKDKQKKKKKNKKTQKQKQKHIKDPSFAPAIINDDFGAAWDGEDKGWKEYIEEKSGKKKVKKSDEKQEIILISSNSNDIIEPVMAMNNDNDENDMEQTVNGPMPLLLTANNLQKHNKLYSINGEFVINKFLDINNENKSPKIVNKNSVKKQQSKSKIVKNSNVKNNAKMVKNSNVKIESKKSVNKLTKTKTPKIARKKSRKDSNRMDTSKVNKDLKQWMVKNSVWDNGLYSNLIINGIVSLENIIGLNQKKLDRILREFRVEKFAKIRNKKSRNHIDKILIKFEKSWKKIRKKKKKKKK